MSTEQTCPFFAYKVKNSAKTWGIPINDDLLSFFDEAKIKFVQSMEQRFLQPMNLRHLACMYQRELELQFRSNLKSNECSEIIFPFVTPNVTGNLAGYTDNVPNKTDMKANLPTAPTAIYTRSSWPAGSAIFKVGWWCKNSTKSLAEFILSLEMGTSLNS